MIRYSIDSSLKVKFHFSIASKIQYNLSVYFEIFHRHFTNKNSSACAAILYKC